MNVSYFRGLPASVWRTALDRRRPTTTARDTTVTAATATGTTTPTAAIDVRSLAQGLARAA